MSWYELYSPKKNEEMIEKLLNKFELDKYNFVMNNYGDYDLMITYGLFSYKLHIDDRKELLYIYRKSLINGGGKFCKEYFKPCKQFHNDVWYNSIKYIKKDK